MIDPFVVLLLPEMTTMPSSSPAASLKMPKHSAGAVSRLRVTGTPFRWWRDDAILAPSEGAPLRLDRGRLLREVGGPRHRAVRAMSRGSRGRALAQRGELRPRARVGHVGGGQPGAPRG